MTSGPPLGRSSSANACRTSRSGRREGHVDREAWLAAGEHGLIGWELPEAYGGSGIRDFRFNAIISEEFYGTGSTGIGLGVQNDILGRTSRTSPPTSRRPAGCRVWSAAS